jgi:hypothetical protein
MAKKVHWESDVWNDAKGKFFTRSACGNIRRRKWMTQAWANVTCLGCRAKYEELFGPINWKALADAERAKEGEGCEP